MLLFGITCLLCVSISVISKLSLFSSKLLHGWMVFLHFCIIWGGIFSLYNISFTSLPLNMRRNKYVPFPEGSPKEGSVRF